MDIAFVDFETTGLSAQKEHIIEVGIVLTHDMVITETYNTLVNPLVPIPEYITRHTNISDRDVANAPSFPNIAEKIQELLKDKLFIAHNAQFDYSFIQEEFQRLSMSFTEEAMCTVKLSRYLYPQYRNHTLDHLIQRHNIVCTNRHRALDDANVMLSFMKAINAEFPESLVKAGMKKAMITRNKTDIKKTYKRRYYRYYS